MTATSTSSAPRSSWQWVFGHWFIAIIVWRAGVIGVYSAIGVTSGLWLGTWTLQVIPVFFFVGGFSNLTTYRAYRRRGEPVTAFLRTRAARLLRPTAMFMAVWLVIEVILHLLGRGGTGLVRGVRLGNTLPFGPLWFLIVYLGVALLSPLTIALHERFRLWVPAALATGAVAVDVLRFAGDVPHVKYLNIGLVWLRWLNRPRSWKAVIAANSVFMTLFLWHMTAYAAAVVLLYPHGLGHPLDSTTSWWLQRPLWEIVPGGRSSWGSSPWSAASSAQLGNHRPIRRLPSPGSGNHRNERPEQRGKNNEGTS